MKKLIKTIVFILLIWFIATIPPIGNFIIDRLEERPYAATTLTVIKQKKELINEIAMQAGVSNITLSAALADEINRSIWHKKVQDFLQDHVLLKYTPAYVIEQTYLWDLPSRYLDFTKQHIGLGSVNIRTAIEVVAKYPEMFPVFSNKKELIEFLLTDKGNIQVAALVLKMGEEKFDRYCSSYDHKQKAAVAVTYYKQGEQYLERYLSLTNGKRPPIPGEGTKLIASFARFEEALK